MLTQPLADAIVEAEKIVRDAPHVRTEQDVVEGLDYLAGSIRAALSSAWGYERDFPFFIRSATPYTKVGLDNPDTLYFSARIREDAREQGAAIISDMRTQAQDEEEQGDGEHAGGDDAPDDRTPRRHRYGLGRMINSCGAPELPLCSGKYTR